MPVIRKYFEIDKTYEYDTNLRRIYPSLEVDTPFGSSFVEIGMGEKTRIHQHHEHETFIVLKGHGTFFFDDQEKAVEAGDVIYIKPFKDHYFQASLEKDLHLLSVWWEGTNDSQKNDSTKNIIFTPPPTPNGNLHLGHISGPYISADVIKRYLECCSKSVKLIVGTDKNQSYVELKASQTNVSPQDIFSSFTKSIFETFNKASVSYDYAHDCNTDFHKEFVKAFIQLMFDKQLIQVEEQEALTCLSCDGNEIFDAFVVGNCPVCGARSNGCVCEDCGSPNNGYDLISPHCNVCNTPANKVRKNKGVLSLSRCRSYSNLALSQINAVDRLRIYLDHQNKQNNENYVVTYSSTWGMPSDQALLNGQVNLCWLEMAAGYIASIYKSIFRDELTDVKLVIEKLNSTEFNVIHLMGFDNSFYYAYLYPQIFAAVGIKKFKVTFVVNEFLLLEESKFSTSRNHAIWANDVFSSPEITDWYRFYLSVKRPENNRENYNSKEFLAFKEKTENQLNSIFKQHSVRLKAYCNNKNPDFGAMTQEQANDQEYFLAQSAYIHNCLSEQENYSVKKYAVAVQNLIEKITRYQQKTEKFDIEHQKTNMAIEGQIISVLRMHLSCLMPNFKESSLVAA